MKARSSVRIAAPLGVVRSVITDFEAYPDFLDTTPRAELLSHSPGLWEVRFGLRLVRDLEYTLELVERPCQGGTRIEWTLVEGAFRANDGAWQLTAEGPSVTLADYEVDLKLGMYVPRSILNTLLGISLPENLERFRARSEAIARAAAGNAPADG